MRKKKWTTPLLTVIVRGKPEERLLAGCKAFGFTPDQYSDLYEMCNYFDEFCYACIDTSST